MKKMTTMYHVILLFCFVLLYSQQAWTNIYTVSNTNNAGAGSLRQAILDANGHAGLDTVRFNFAPGSGLQTINLTSALPTPISSPVLIDGTSHPDYAGVPLIELNGTNAGASSGLTISAGGSTVVGLVINRFTNYGILLQTSGGDTIKGCYIGTNAAGTAAAGNGNSGIYINNVPNTLVGGAAASSRNVISGNSTTSGNGLYVTGAGATGTTIQGNYIGTNAAGNGAIPNNSDAVSLHSLTGATITGNVISGTAGATMVGIWINGCSGVNVQGNYIGTNATGSAALGNTSTNIWIDGASTNNTIGGTTVAARNIISGSVSGNGVVITGAGTTGNIVQGNYIGTNAAGTAAIPNAKSGISLDCTGNTIGGTGGGNLIAYNTQEGIRIQNTGGSCANRNIVTSNTITGNGDGASKFDGIFVINVNCDSIAGNVLNANGYFAIRIISGSTNITASGNTLTASNPSGGTTGGAIGVFTGSKNNKILFNTLKDTKSMGIAVGDTLSTGNTVAGNLIVRTTPNITPARGRGIFVYSGGDTTKVFHNTIDSSTTDGIVISGGVKAFRVQNNILTNNGGAGLNAPNEPGATVSNNDYFGNVGGSVTGGTGIGSGSITSDPQYVNRTADNFSLTECSSPCINAGIDLGVNQPDMNGATAGNFNGPAPDMGAFETSCIVVPIQLSSFTARPASGSEAVVLTWTTITETNNYGFEVQRKSSGSVDFTSLANSFIAGHGTTLQPQTYLYTDATVSTGQWWYRLKQIDLDGSIHYTDPVQVDVLTDVKDGSKPTTFVLEQNYPNPFNPETVIRYEIPGTRGQGSGASDARLVVYDLLGREVAVLVNERQAPGSYSVTFNANGLASGVYLYRLTAGPFRKTKTLMLMK